MMHFDHSNPDIEFESSERVEEESEAIDAMLNLMGYDPDETFVSDVATFSQMGLEQIELDTVLPIIVDMQWTLLRGIYEIRRSIPNWPRSKALQ